MDQDAVRRRAATMWRSPEVLAALLNGALASVAPAAFVAYADYTGDAVRPFQSTLWSSAVWALPVLLAFTPVSFLVAWRTYVHAIAYGLNRMTVWRGPVEGAAIAGGIALIIMVRATTGTWAREPPHLVAAYIAIYVILTALVGLVLGLVLAATALAVIFIRSRGLGARAF